MGAEDIPMKRKKGSRPRTERRRLARKAKQQAPNAGKDQNLVHVVGNYDPSIPPALHDDCPYCRALAAVGAKLDANGNVELSPQEQDEYECHLARFLEEEGLPEGAVVLSPDQLEYEFIAAATELAGQGLHDDVDRMSDAELDALTMRVFRTMRERTLAEASTAAADRN
jgi:hypothetical protein